MAKTAEQMVSSGVKELIKKLEKDGVEKGRAQADSIIADAEKTAKKIVSDAKAEADKLRSSAKSDAEKFAAAGADEIKMASRDAMLALRKEIEQTFSKRIGDLMADTLGDKKLLEKVILEIASGARDKAKVDNAKKIDVILPETVVSLNDLRQNGKGSKADDLTKLAMGVTKDMLRDGVTFSSSNKISGGVKVYIKDTNVEVDLSDKAVAEILLSHLHPRFRAVLEGAVK